MHNISREQQRTLSDDQRIVDEIRQHAHEWDEESSDNGRDVLNERYIEAKRQREAIFKKAESLGLTDVQFLELVDKSPLKETSGLMGGLRSFFSRMAGEPWAHIDPKQLNKLTRDFVLVEADLHRTQSAVFGRKALINEAVAKNRKKPIESISQMASRIQTEARIGDQRVADQLALQNMDAQRSYRKGIKQKAHEMAEREERLASIDKHEAKQRAAWEKKHVREMQMNKRYDELKRERELELKALDKHERQFNSPEAYQARRKAVINSRTLPEAISFVQEQTAQNKSPEQLRLESDIREELALSAAREQYAKRRNRSPVDTSRRGQNSKSKTG